MKTMMLALAVTTGLLIARVSAQREDHHPGDANKTGSMMQGGIMAQMPMMMMGQSDTSKLADQLAKSFAAIETETDPTALKAKLAEHGALLKELQTKVQTQSQMMEMMQHMTGGPAKAGASDSAK